MHAKYKIFMVFALMGFLSNSIYSQNKYQEEYIIRYSTIAIGQMEQYGIPASIILAQACLESSFGKSRLAIKANNHFGIKCHDWKGETIRHDDDKKNECFRKYQNATESFKDHSEFLRYRTRYRALFDLDIKDYKAWAHGLKAAGYATNPQYAQLLINLIEKYSLYKYDTPVATLPDSPGKVLTAQALNPQMGSYFYEISLKRAISTKNGVAFVIAMDGESYSSIAKEFSLFKRELIGFNDLKGNPTLKPGTLVYVQKKKRRAPMETPKHIASGNESLQEISQNYGIRLKSLLKINNLDKDHIPKEGSTINLIGK